MSQATPAAVPGLPTALQVAAGWRSSYALLADGSVWAWGRNDQGQLGAIFGGASGELTAHHRASPVRIVSFPSDTEMRLSPGSAMALTMFVVLRDGTAMGSGWNLYGQMGTGDTTNVVIASPIRGLGGGILEIARGGGHTLVLKGG